MKKSMKNLKTTKLIFFTKNYDKKIMKRLIPIKLQNYNGWSSALPNNSSLEFIYDDNKLNIHRVWIFNCFCRKSD